MGISLITVLVLLLLTLRSVEGRKTCPEGEELCADGIQCSQARFMCNGIVNGCEDGSDEWPSRCLGRKTCPEGEDFCEDGIQCTNTEYMCNGYEGGCMDGSDEKPSRCLVFDCGTGKRKCGDGLQCIDNGKWCDGDVDCNDETDEVLTTCKPEPCSAGEYLNIGAGYTCNPCQEDHYNPEGYATFCTKCPIDRRVSAGAGGEEVDCIWKECPAGWFKSSDKNLCQRYDAMCQEDNTQCGDSTSFLNTSTVQCGSCPAREYSDTAELKVCIQCSEKEKTLLSEHCMKCICDHPEYDENCEAACQSLPESDEIYGSYLWPTTLPGEVAQIQCAYNSGSEEMAYKQCDSTTNTFEETNFTMCKSIFYHVKTKAEKIKSPEEQEDVSIELRDLTQENASLMSSKDVEMTSDIIDNLINFSRRTDLNDTVTSNILKTVDSVHKSTSAKELSYSVASRMRNSFEKLADKISEKPIYNKEQTIGVVVNTTGNEISFAISGDQNDVFDTELSESDINLVFAAKVPANKEESPVVALLYNSSKFYPDETTVEDITSAFAEHFINRNVPKKVVKKVVSWIAEIKYAGSTERINFDDGKMIKMTFSVREENPDVHYQMALKSSYECTFYDTRKGAWLSGAESGCTTTVQVGRNKKTLVSCQCSHMTSFAVLLLFEGYFDPLEINVTLILLGISLACLVLTILSYLPAKKVLRTSSERMTPLLVASLIFSIITFYFMEYTATSKETDSTWNLCLVIAFLMNYFWLCQVAWMVCKAVMLYRTVVSNPLNPHIHRYMIKFNLACWGIPLIFPITGIIWGRSDFANPNTCFLNKKYGLVTFYGPLVLGILFNISSFIRIAWSLHKHECRVQTYLATQMKRGKGHFKRALKIMILLGIAWLFGFFLIIEKVNTIWLRWLFIISNSTQGIFIFILHAAMNNELRTFWRKRITTSEDPSHFSSSQIYRTRQIVLVSSLKREIRHEIELHPIPRETEITSP